MFGITEDGTYRVESIGFSTPELTEGYVVAVRPIQREADIPTEGTLFGRWTNYSEDVRYGEGEYDYETKDVVYWDEVEVIGNIWYALDTANRRGELAIWDLAESRELRVADYYPAINFID